MAEQYLFLTNEGADKLMIVMTYGAMSKLDLMISSVKEQWGETDDFAYFALSGGLSRRGELADHDND